MEGETKTLQSGCVSFTWPTSSAVQTLKRSSEPQGESSATLFIRLYPIRVRSVVDWATPKGEEKGKKKAISDSFILLLHSLPLSGLPYAWKSQVISQQSSVWWSGQLLNHVPGQLSESAGRSTSLGELGSWQEKKKKKEFILWLWAAGQTGECRGGAQNPGTKRDMKPDECHSLMKTKTVRTWT